MLPLAPSALSPKKYHACGMDAAVNSPDAARGRNWWRLRFVSYYSERHRLPSFCRDGRLMTRN